MSEHKYSIIMDYIKNEILDGTLKSGDKVDSESQLMKKFNVSRHTAREALARLCQEGYIYTEHGRGSFVKGNNESAQEQKNITDTIILIVSYLNNQTVPEIIQKIEEKASENGYNILLYCTYNKVFKEKEILQRIVKENIVGVIAEPSKSALPFVNESFYEQIRQKGIPVLYFHGYHNEKEDEYVIVDDLDAGYKAAKYLLEAGHVNIGGIFKSDDIQEQKRYQGMMKALYEYNVEINENQIIWMSTEDEKIILKDSLLKSKFLNRILSCTAVICYNDFIALGIADYLETNGKQIPDDCSIISFDNTLFGDAYRVPITSVDHPKGKLGEMVAEKFFEKLKDPEKKIQIKMKVDVVEKESVKKIGSLL